MYLSTYDNAHGRDRGALNSHAITNNKIHHLPKDQRPYSMKMHHWLKTPPARPFLQLMPCAAWESGFRPHVSDELLPVLCSSLAFIGIGAIEHLSNASAKRKYFFRTRAKTTDQKRRGCRNASTIYQRRGKASDNAIKRKGHRYES